MYTQTLMTTKTFEINELPNFLRYGAPLAHLRHAGGTMKPKKSKQCVLDLIIYMKKILNSDWLRAVRFKCNTSANSGL